MAIGLSEGHTVFIRCVASQKLAFCTTFVAFAASSRVNAAQHVDTGCIVLYQNMQNLMLEVWTNWIFLSFSAVVYTD